MAIPTANPVDEDARPKPESPYGTSKLMSEWILRDAAAAHGLSAVVLRYFNVAGADPAGRTGQSTPNATHLIKVACEAAVGKRKGMQIFGTDYATPDGTCIRDYIHVTDLIDAHVAALRHLRKGGENLTLNCGYGRGYSVREVVDAVKRVSGVDFPVTLVAAPAGRPCRDRGARRPHPRQARLAAETRRSGDHRHPRARLGAQARALIAGPMQKIRKAVFPVAGLGTRFLPATKAMPKEMLTIVDRPLIQYAFDEAREAGIEHFIFVTGRNKAVIEDHFDRQFELEITLAERGKRAELEVLERDLPAAGSISYTRQQSPLGLGHAVLCAAELVGREPFALLLPDVLVQAKRGCLAQMTDAYGSLGDKTNMIAVEEVPAEDTHKYGVVGIGPKQGNSFAISTMVEKPERGKAPSNMIITGRYILQPEIFDHLASQERGAGGEIQLTDAMLRLAERQRFWGFAFEGRTFDCGSKVGFLAANVAYALSRPDIAPAFRTELERLTGKC